MFPARNVVGNLGLSHLQVEQWFLRVGAPSLQPLDARLTTLKVDLEYEHELSLFIAHCDDKRAAAVSPRQLNRSSLMSTACGLFAIAYEKQWDSSS